MAWRRLDLLFDVLTAQWTRPPEVEHEIDRWDLADLHRAVRDDRADVWTYRYHGQDCAGFLAPNDFTEPAPLDEPFVWVAYSATFRVIRTGYKTGGFHKVFPSSPPERVIRHTG